MNELAGWLLGVIVTSSVITIGWFFFTEMLPKMVARRTVRAPQHSLTQLPGANRPVAPVVDAESSLQSTKHTHDVFVDEAADLVRQSRAAGLFTGSLLEEAAVKANDAVKLRPGSFPANLLAGEIAVKRALLPAATGAIELLEEAAIHFATASDTKRGIIDAYVGRGWAHLERAHLLTGDDAAPAFLDAAAAFGEGFAVSPQNLFILRGWGLAIDGATRSLGADQAEVRSAEEAYRAALAQHRGGDHELHKWFATVLEASEPTRLPMPPLRDVN